MNSSKSCFSYQSLARIARRFNEANPREPIPISRNRKELWHAIRKRVPECHDERCWTDASWLKHGDRDAIVEDFKPPIPHGRYQWLNSDDIDRVLSQYERVFPTFAFLGTHPIDFQSVYRDVVTALGRAMRRSDTRSIGLVLNLDYHDEPGSHWVAVFIDKTAKTLEYFDSFGEKAPTEVENLFRRMPRGYRYLENRVIHQRKNTECGNYAINFIVQRLRGSSFARVTRNVIRDDTMNRKRRVYFDPLHSTRT